jgi:glycosyltransferase involved in cell wall biosynthesis
LVSDWLELVPNPDSENDLMDSTSFDIVILALPRWDGLYSSTAYSLAKSLSTYTRVFYIDNPFTWKDFLVRRKSPRMARRKRALLKGQDRFVTPDERYPNLIAVTPELVYPNNWLPAGFFYDAMARVNDGIVNRTLNELFRHFKIDNFVFINSFNPLYGKYFSGLKKPLLSIYHCVDDISKSVYVARHGTRLELEMMRKFDVTLVTSMALKGMKQELAKKLYYLPNAADVELFQQSWQLHMERPAELKQIPGGRRVIFYMGNICHRLDYDLLTKIARRFPNDYLVLVGPITKDEYWKRGLDKFPNVIATGNKQLEELPAYIKYADCCIIPFALTPLTQSIYPLKINEYLSAGKPVVTTRFSGDIVTFASVAVVADSHDEFLENVALSMAHDSEQKAAARVAFASSNNWNARAIELMQIINENIHIDGN